MTSSVSPSPRPLVQWTHETLVSSQVPTLGARSAVARQLVAHEVAHLAGAAGVVAGIFARDVALRGGAALVVTLSRVNDVVCLGVEAAATGAVPRSADRETLVDLDPGRGIPGLLCLDWGVSAHPGDIDGLWARFDARDRRRSG